VTRKPVTRNHFPHFQIFKLPHFQISSCQLTTEYFPATATATATFFLCIFESLHLYIFYFKASYLFLKNHTNKKPIAKPMDKNEVMLPDEVIMSKIYFIRGMKVMLDSDLAEMYGVETKVLKRAVRRKIDRFPKDFMFELTNDEHNNLRSNFGTSSWGGARYVPMAFTEHGVLMLSSVLNSAKAIKVNIQIMRIFTKIHRNLSDNLLLRLEIDKIKKSLEDQGENIKEIFTYMDELIKEQKKPLPRKRIGFRLPEKRE